MYYVDRSRQFTYYIIRSINVINKANRGMCIHDNVSYVNWYINQVIYNYQCVSLPRFVIRDVHLEIYANCYVYRGAYLMSN